MYFSEHSELLHVISINFINIFFFLSGETMVYGAQVNNLGYMVLSNRPGILTPVSLASLNSYALCYGIQN